MIKRIIPVITAVLLCFSLCSCSLEKEEKYPAATEKFFVNDFADIIDAKDEDEIYSMCVALFEKTTAQVVVVTVNSLKGEEPADYATELGRKWGVGTKDKDNGVLLLLSTDERQVYIAVGYGLEGALPDSKTGRILDVYGTEKFRNDEFSSGLLAVSKALVNEVYIENGIEPEKGYVSIDKIKDPEPDTAELKKVAVSWGIMIVIIIIFSLIFRKKLFFVFWGPRGPRGGHGGFYGSFGGGSSFGGGGFGGFSGGGGSFGGGGAGRGF